MNSDPFIIFMEERVKYLGKNLSDMEEKQTADHERLARTKNPTLLMSYQDALIKNRATLNLLAESIDHTKKSIDLSRRIKELRSQN